MTTAVAESVPATEKQIPFLRSLIAERVCDDEYAHGILCEIEQGTLSKFRATDEIGWLLKQAKREGVKKSAPKKQNVAAEEGFYMSPEKVVWKVQKSEQGNFYAKELVIIPGEKPHCNGHYAADGHYFTCGVPAPSTASQNAGTTHTDEWVTVDYGCYDVTNPVRGKFVFRPGAMKDFQSWEPMTLAAAMEFGACGVCGMCGRTLTNPESIEAGIGPICRDKF